MFVTRILFVTWLCVACSGQWMTSYDKPFKLECPDQEVVKDLVSQHDNYYTDRVWNMSCSGLPNQLGVGGCEWSGYINYYDDLFEYQCAEEMVIAGITGVYDNNYEDRKFSFKCCSPEGGVAHSCMNTPYVNEYGQLFNYRVPDGYGIKGVNSQNDDSHKDRIFKFVICKLDRMAIVGK